MGSVFFSGADILGDSPTAVADVPGAVCLADCAVSDGVGEFPIVGVVLHRCDEVILVEKGSPVLLACLDYVAVVGALVGVCASGIDGIVIICEEIKRGVGFDCIFDEICLGAVGLDVP